MFQYTQHWLPPFGPLDRDTNTPDSAAVDEQSRGRLPPVAPSSAWHMECATILGRHLHDLAYLDPQCWSARALTAPPQPLPIAIVERLALLLGS